MKEHHAKHTPEHKPEPPKAAGHPGPAPAPSELDQLKDRLLRLQADFENYRKRTARERTEICERAAEDLVLELLPVLDHFELGLRNAREHGVNGSVVDGFQLVYDQLVAALAKSGLTPLETIGALFDPHLHEALQHVPSEEQPADTIIGQARTGYLLGKKLLRAAQVVVSSGPPAPLPPPAAETDPAEAE